MIKVNINKTKWQLPERLTVDEWAKVQKWSFELPEHWPLIIEDISGISHKEFEGAEEESMQLFIGFLIGAINKRTPSEYPQFSELKFGQFVDLDCFLAIGVEKQIKPILEVLGVTTPWADEALLVIEQYIKWRTVVFKQYKLLFGIDQDQHEAEEPAEFDPKKVSRGWYDVMVELAGQDILKMDQIAEEPLHKVLTFLQIKKEKAIMLAAQQRKLNKKR